MHFWSKILGWNSVLSKENKSLVDSDISCNKFFMSSFDESGFFFPFVTTQMDEGQSQALDDLCPHS